MRLSILPLLPLLTLGCAPVVATVEPLSDPPIEDDPTPIEQEWDWTATLFLGGLDRIVVVGTREASPRCATLRLVWPGWDEETYPDLVMPSEWGIEGAGMSDDGCDDPFGGDVYPMPITQMAGRIEFNEAYPPQRLTMETVASGADWGPETFSADIEIDP